jgi:hypothetical protein
VPTPRKVLGYDFGDRVSSHANIVKYIKRARMPSRSRSPNGGSCGAASGNIERAPGRSYASEADLEKAEQPDTQAPWPAHGFLAKAKVDPEQWICAGVPETGYALVSGPAIYTPIKVDRGANAVVFAGSESVMASGYCYSSADRATRVAEAGEEASGGSS